MHRHDEEEEDSSSLASVAVACGQQPSWLSVGFGPLRSAS
jgi:hypothetical protein